MTKMHERILNLIDCVKSHRMISMAWTVGKSRSPCYAAPEMIAGKYYVPSLCDVWSCGVILFAMICGSSQAVQAGCLWRAEKEQSVKIKWKIKCFHKWKLIIFTAKIKHFSWSICQKIVKNQKMYCWNFAKNWAWSGAKGFECCRSRKIWKNAPTLAIVAVDTAENEPSKVI